MKLGLTTKHYPNHGTVIVPCDSQGNALEAVRSHIKEAASSKD